MHTLVAHDSRRQAADANKRGSLSDDIGATKGAVGLIPEADGGPAIDANVRLPERRNVA
jgi:hypothetical protein